MFFGQQRMPVEIPIFLFVLSLPGTAFCAHSECTLGWVALLFGEFGLVTGQISWLANLLVIGCWCLLAANDRDGHLIALIFSIAAFALGNAFLFQGVTTNESGGPGAPVSSLDVGYWLWMGSIVISGLLAAFGFFSQRACAR